MMLEAVIIILREVLEAAMLTSLLLAIGKLSGIRLYWFFFGLAIGLIGAWSYANAMAWISELFDYTGQERINGFIQIGIYLAAFSVLVLMRVSPNVRSFSPLTVMMAITVALAVTREGSEVIIYLQTFSFDQMKLVRVLTGGVVGACIGASTGVIVYFALVLGDKRRAMVITQWLLILVAAGILSQIVPLFEQADLIASAEPIWDSSSLLAETSVMGQLLYAIMGYEATPTAVQLGIYCLGLAAFALMYFASNRGRHGIH